MWDYLHDKGVRIETKPTAEKIGMTYIVSLEGKEIGTIATSSPKGKSIITSSFFYDVICEDKNIDLVVLVAFSIARTDQVTYD